MYTIREAVGVVAAIVPWNLPILLACYKLGPALAAGCTVVIKSSEWTPLSLLLLAKLIAEAGVPAGVVNVLSGYGVTAGEAMIRHADVDKISFTGSTRVGKRILEVAGSVPGRLARVSLELGGKSPSIVLASADVAHAARATIDGCFFNAGQCCCASSRVFVHRSVYDAFVEAARKVIASIRLGHQFEEGTVQGPQVHPEHVKRILAKLSECSGRVVTGGRACGNNGMWIEPTLVTDVADDAAIVREEVFGPVMCVLPFDDVDEAVARANDTEYGLAGAVFAESVEDAHAVASRLRAGTVWINCYYVLDTAAPFGGFKASGIGRELGMSGVDLYLETKTVIVPLKRK